MYNKVNGGGGLVLLASSLLDTPLQLGYEYYY